MVCGFFFFFFFNIDRFAYSQLYVLLASFVYSISVMSLGRPQVIVDLLQGKLWIYDPCYVLLGEVGDKPHNEITNDQICTSYDRLIICDD